MNKLAAEQKEEVFNYLMGVTGKVIRGMNPKPEESPPINNSKNASWYYLKHARQLMIGAYYSEINLDKVYEDEGDADKLKSTHPIFLRCLIETLANIIYINGFEGEEVEQAINGIKIHSLKEEKNLCKKRVKDLKDTKIAKDFEDLGIFNKTERERLIKKNEERCEEIKKIITDLKKNKKDFPKRLEQRILQGSQGMNHEKPLVNPFLSNLLILYRRCNLYVHASLFVADTSSANIGEIFEIYALTLSQFKDYLKKEEIEYLDNVLSNKL